MGDLRSIEEQAPDGTLMRIWSTPGKEEHGRFALETSIRLLAYFNDYFGIPYPLQKMDHLAIPDFAAGAMENWGAITYRESALLVDPENSSSGTRQIVASIIAHEMAHMWFGDLVTMAWWNDLWLNESFASWMGDKAVNDLFPEWQMWTQFLSADTNRALSLDGLTNSHPIEQEVANPAQIQQMFDDISYSKGASIIRMLEGFLGSDAFREGLRAYLREHEYGNAETRDLWKSLAEASGQPVSSMMDTWTAQMGYPVLDVTADRSDDGVSVHLSQKRFVYESILGGGDDDDSAWSVPVGAIADGADEPAFALMDGREATVRVSASARPAWVKINPEQTGFYRVNYQDDDLTALIGPIERGELSPSDRLGIQNDAYALARAGLAPVTRFLSIAPAYRNEDTAPVASDLAVNLAGLDSILSEEPYHAKFQAYARDIFAPIGHRMGWEPQDGEGHLDALLRSTVLEALGRYEDSDALSEAAAKLQRYVTDSSSVPPGSEARRVQSRRQAGRRRHLGDDVGPVQGLAAARGEGEAPDGAHAVQEPRTAVADLGPRPVRRCADPGRALPDSRHRDERLRPRSSLGLPERELGRNRSSLRRGRIHDHAPRLIHLRVHLGGKAAGRRAVLRRPSCAGRRAQHPSGPRTDQPQHRMAGP